MQGSFRGISVVRDFPLYVIRQLVVVPQFDVRPLGPQILPMAGLKATGLLKRRGGGRYDPGGEEQIPEPVEGGPGAGPLQVPGEGF